MTATVEAIAVAIVVLVASVGGVLAAFANLANRVAELRKAIGALTTTTDGVAAEVRPNHGGSLADKVTAIAQRQDDQTMILKSLGHQLGEITDNALIIHDDHAARLRDLERRR